MDKNYSVLSRHLILDDEQTLLLHKIFSGLLPHANYDSQNASAVQKELFTVLPVTEVYGVNFLFYRMLSNINAIRNTYNSESMVLGRDNFEACMQHYVGNVIRKPEFDEKLFFAQLGREFDLGNPDEYEEAIDIVFSYAMDCYDDIFGMAISSGEAYTYILPLKDSLLTSLVERSMNIEAEVLKHSVLLNGVTYSGPEDALTLRKLHQNEIDTRFAAGKNTATRELLANSYLTAQQYRKDNPNIIKPLAYFGYDPVDKMFPMRTQDIICLIADEGVGKTKITLDWVHTLLMAGINVCVICGETDIVKYLTFLIINHIFYKEKKTFSYDEFTNRELIPHDSLEELEQWNILIDGCENDLLSNPAYGKVLLKQNLPYEDFYSYIKNEVIQHEVQVVVVDHVAILNSNGSRTVDGYLDNDKKRIDWLYRQEDALAKELNTAFINTVHTQNDASEKINSGKKVGIRIAGGSSATTKYGSLVMLLRTTEELEKQSIYLLQFKKVRDYAKPPTLALCRNGTTASHWYNAGMQHFVTGEVDNITSTRIDTLIGAAPVESSEDDLDDEFGLDI